MELGLAREAACHAAVGWLLYSGMVSERSTHRIRHVTDPIADNHSIWAFGRWVLHCGHFVLIWVFTHLVFGSPLACEIGKISIGCDVPVVTPMANGMRDFPGRDLFDKACVAMATESGDKSQALGELSAALGDAVEK
jgi:hypothetical protein